MAGLFTLIQSLIDMIHPTVANGVLIILISYVLWLLHLHYKGAVKTSYHLSERVSALENTLDEKEKGIRAIQNSHATSLDSIRSIYSMFLQTNATMASCKILIEDYVQGHSKSDCNQPGGLEQCMSNIVHFVRNDMRTLQAEVHRTSIWVPNEDKTYLHIMAGAGFTKDQQRVIRLKMEDSIAGSVFRTLRPRICPTASDEVDFQHVEESGSFQSLICVPIVGYKGALGVLSIDAQTKDVFDEHDRLLAETYGAVIALYLEQGLEMEGVTA